MNSTFHRICAPVAEGIVRISEHGYEELAADGSIAREIVEVVETAEEPEGWSPYLSLEGAVRLDDVREALRRGDVKTAAGHSRVFSLAPAAV